MSVIVNRLCPMTTGDAQDRFNPTWFAALPYQFRFGVATLSDEFEHQDRGISNHDLVVNEDHAGNRFTRMKFS